jgi:hypothetical protein
VAHGAWGRVAAGQLYGAGDDHGERGNGAGGDRGDTVADGMRALRATLARLRRWAGSEACVTELKHKAQGELDDSGRVGGA